MSKLEHIVKRFFGKRSLPSVIRAVRNDCLTYLEEEALRDLYDEVARLEKENAPGVLVEAGCALGGSAIVLATAKRKTRPLYVFDVFGMIPPPSDNDGNDVHERYESIVRGESQGIRGNKYYGYERNLIEKVAENFSAHGVAVDDNAIDLIKGLFEETLFLRDQVALAHIDSDWYESVMTCLQRIEPRLIGGGVLVIDDYYAWSGCKSAVDEYFEEKRDEYEFVKKARLHIVRKQIVPVREPAAGSSEL